MLSSAVEGLSQDLEEKFGGQKSYVCLVGTDDLFSLGVHTANVVLVTIIELVHLPDQVVSLIS